jgi:hypothetical protein
MLGMLSQLHTADTVIALNDNCSRDVALLVGVGMVPHT